MKIRVGDILHREPEIYASTGMERPGVMPCKVIWIHPERRFYVVEYESALGRRWRESVWIPPAPERLAKTPDGYHWPRRGRKRACEQ